jgi:hypothetical protein
MILDLYTMNLRFKSKKISQNADNQYVKFYFFKFKD